MMTFINLILIILLLLANGFFVASEFALVSVRQTRINQLANEGSKTAVLALQALKELDKYIAATQLGITISSIGLGWVGEAAIAKIIKPLLDFLPFVSNNIATHTIAVAAAFVLITVLHVVIGELMPKSIALQYPEKTTLLITRPLVFTAKLFAPFIFILNGLGNRLLKLLNISTPDHSHSVHTEEELSMIIDASYKGGILNETEKFMLKKTLKFNDLTAKQIMVPRCEVVSVSTKTEKKEMEKIMQHNHYSRYPVYQDNFDNVTGILHVKDYYCHKITGHDFEIQNILRKPLFVPETATLDVILQNFKTNKTEIAIVIDEFGGMSGIITLEDVLEEIIGEVQDEFDDEEFDIKKTDENKYIINGLLRLDEFFEYFEIESLAEAEGIETVSGLFPKMLGRMAQKGDEITVNKLKIKVLELKGKRIKKVLAQII